MSNYNSENTTVLETREQAGGNKRMLLLHVRDDGSHEYIIGSYFTETPYALIKFSDPPAARNLVEYSWDWGHYFDGIVDAVEFWEEEVLS